MYAKAQPAGTQYLIFVTPDNDWLLKPCPVSAELVLARRAGIWCLPERDHIRGDQGSRVGGEVSDHLCDLVGAGDMDERRPGGDAAEIFRQVGDRRFEGAALGDLGLALRNARPALAPFRDRAARSASNMTLFRSS